MSSTSAVTPLHPLSFLPYQNGTGTNSLTILTLPTDILGLIFCEKNFHPLETPPPLLTCRRFKQLGALQQLHKKDARQHFDIRQHYRMTRFLGEQATNPMAMATLRGCLSLVQWYHRTLRYPLLKTTFRNAARSGNLELLRWLQEKRCPWSLATSQAAAGEGHIHVLQWAHANGCPWNEWACANAAWGGHLSVLQWLRQNGCPWDESTCHMATKEGHLELLEWAHANGCPWNARIFDLAETNGRHHIVAWLRIHF